METVAIATVLLTLLAANIGLAFPDHKIAPMVWIVGMTGWLATGPIAPMIMALAGYSGPEWHFVAAYITAYAVPVWVGAAIISVDEYRK